MQEYMTAVYRDFSDPVVKAAFQAALDKVQSELGKKYPLIIGGKEVWTEQEIVSTNPSKQDEVVGIAAKAGIEEGEQALCAAEEAFKTWKKFSHEKRARFLFRAAGIMKRRRDELSAWMVIEAGKNWVEADADTCEAIDFMEYYGRQMLKWGGEQKVYQRDGEDNAFVYIPMGPGVVIPPWNFPLAITCGTTVAAVVAGNTVVLKPAGSTPVIAYKLMEVLIEAGLPDGVVNYLPGSGAVVGDYMVQSPKTYFVNFTGSKEVGLGIAEKASVLAKGQRHMKRVIAEMGGKDATVVAEDADLEAAADGIVKGAFGFQGQKCSACSRAIIVAEVYDEVVAKIVEKTKALTLGPAKDNNNVGPVITQGAMDGIMQYIEIGKGEGKLLTGGKARQDLGGYFIEPTVIGEADRNARIAQEEIFGPVLTVIKAKDFADALDIANDTEYGLTGAVFATSREYLEKAREEYMVGNLYLNRKCTGALVGIQPFGGFKLSGTDSKAGGPEYLLLFMQGKSIAEKL